MIVKQKEQTQKGFNSELRNNLIKSLSDYLFVVSSDIDLERKMRDVLNNLTSRTT